MLKYLLATLGLTFAFAMPTVALAQDTQNSGTSATSNVSLINPLGTTDPRVIIGGVIRSGLSIIGSVTLVMFIYGGVLWITSMGNDKLVQKGKQVLVWTVIGLAVIAGAYTITNAVISGLTECSVVPGSGDCTTTG